MNILFSSIDGIEDSLVLTFFLLVNDQQGKFFNVVIKSVNVYRGL